MWDWGRSEEDSLRVFGGWEGRSPLRVLGPRTAGYRWTDVVESHRGQGGRTLSERRGPGLSSLADSQGRTPSLVRPFVSNSQTGVLFSSRLSKGRPGVPRFFYFYSSF